MEIYKYINDINKKKQTVQGGKARGKENGQKG